MSDDGSPPVGGVGELNDEDDTDGTDGMGLTSTARIPDGMGGFIKEIVTEANEAHYGMPRAGDEVTVHYVGVLEADGSEFDSTRANRKPFVFMLGKGQVSKGLDKGVATMGKGEVAKFTLAPDLAYGERGSPPKIPPRASLTFEVELIRWVSNDDLFNDVGVIKSQIAVGSGWMEPNDADEVRISMTAQNMDGILLEEQSSIEYILGSGTLGRLTKAVDKALRSMKEGEEVRLTCAKDYAYGDQEPDGVMIELKLEQIYKTKDISLSKDKSFMKKQIKEGEGWDNPKDCSKVTLKVVAATDGELALPGFAEKTLEFTAGNGEVCDALELMVPEMTTGECAALSCTTPELCAEEQLGLREVIAEKVVLTLELEAFEKAKDTWSMSEEETMKFAVARKEVGGSLFRKGRVALAMQRYKQVVDLFSSIDDFEDGNKSTAKELRKLCELNCAACQLKFRDFVAAKESCQSVLRGEPANIKGLFRRAQAELGLNNVFECRRDLRKLIHLDPQNKEARALLKEANASRRESDSTSTGHFAEMCKGLGERPTSEPCTDQEPAPVPELQDPSTQQPMDEVSGAPCAQQPAAEVSPAPSPMRRFHCSCPAWDLLSSWI